MQNPDTINRRNLIAFSLRCVFLSAVEYVIPKPLPFMRLGLANMPLVLALYVFGAKEILLLVLLKILGQGFITGTLFHIFFCFRRQVRSLRPRRCLCCSEAQNGR